MCLLTSFTLIEPYFKSDPLKNKILLLLFSFCWLIVDAQKTTISGVVVDDLNFFPLQNATITLAKSSDSLLIGYKRANQKGSFIFDKIPFGKYDVFISYPDYLGYAGEVTIDEQNSTVKLDTVFMLKNSRLLDEVTILDGSKIKFKGDTIQFVADSFKVGPNANVEDLLKKLSGLQVNSKGEIRAFGEKVEKVYVDGEEFFGDDPTIATRNIQAKAIDKVQVFDKTSEMEELTGISDGDKIKAINLTLKDEYKKGYFGKATAGIGTKPTYYDGSLLLQGYTGRSKLAVYGIASNTGTTGLNFDDMNKFLGSQGNMTMTEEGDMMFYSSGEDDFDWDGRYNGQGLPSSLAGGASYSTKLSKDKIRINANYGYSDQRLDKISSVNKTNFLPEESFASEETELLTNRVINNSGKLALEMDIDSFTSLKYNFSGSKKDLSSNKEINSTISGLDSVAITDIDRELNSEGFKNSINNTLSLTKKFKKKKRLLTFNGGYNYSEDEGTTKLLSNNIYFRENKTEILDQLQIKDNSNTRINGRITYNEPLGEKWSTQGNYYYNLATNQSSKKVNAFDEASQSYSRFIDTLSNIFDYRINTNGGGLALAMKDEKYNFRFGTNLDYTTYTRDNKIDSTRIVDNALRWLPTATFNYKFSRTDNLRFSYNGYTTQPTINQIQPVRDNSDPLNQVKGNPDLEQSYSQNFNLSYNMWKALSEVSIWSYGGFSNVFNQIVNYKIVDTSGRNIYTYTNVDGSYNGYMGANFNKKLSRLFSFRLGLNASLGKSISVVNLEESKVLNTSIRPTLGLEFEKEEVFDLSLTYAPAFVNSSGGLVQEAGNYTSHHFDAYFRYNITKSLEFTTEINYDIQPAQSSFSEKFSQAIWNADIQYTLDKSKNFIVKCAVNDILDQNKGYRRSISANETQVSRNNTIRRYFFLSFIYNIKSKI